MKISANIRNVFKISSGTVAGQLCSVVSLPFITRIYGADIIGAWAIITSVSGIVNTISDIGLTNSLMVCEEKGIENQYRAISALNVAVCSLCTPLVALYCALLSYDAARMVTVVVCTLIYSITLQQVSINYMLLNRRQEYDVLMKNPLINQLVAAAASIALGVTGFISWGYFVGMIAGQIVTLAHMRRRVAIPYRRVPLAYYRSLLSRERDFIINQTPSNIAYQVRSQLPTLIIGSLFGTTVLGNFSIAQKLLNIPVTFIGQAVGNVFYQRIASMREDVGAIARFVQRNMRRTMLVAIAPMAFLIALGGPIIDLVFGSGYELGGAMVGVIGFQSLFSFLTASIKGVDIVLGKQRYSMLTGIGHAIVAPLSMTVAYLATGDVIVCVAAMVAGFIVVQVPYYATLYRYMGLSVPRYLVEVLAMLIGTFLLSVLIREVVGSFIQIN
ncbi:oligosaccharide flippase family protein [Collinsella sp. An307]|uniref:oligosaccharide flippase family protein n=1 Tax=Collinsella sp. An307 TaxID=1965630 RepID=UPI000B39BB89|nr:oligosaccharide flippase family protein [Collinsella sp. An307]OUO22420.1 hypothetical protein B5F89_00855 [Collinsella sp. An307]